MILNASDLAEQYRLATEGSAAAMLRLAGHFCAQNYLGDATYFLRAAQAAGAIVTKEATWVASRCGPRLTDELRQYFALPNA